MDRKNWTGHELRRLAIVLVLGLGVFSHSRTARADEDLQLKLVWVNTATEFPLAFDLGMISYGLMVLASPWESRLVQSPTDYSRSLKPLPLQDLRYC